MTRLKLTGPCTPHTQISSGATTEHTRDIRDIIMIVRFSAIPTSSCPVRPTPSIIYVHLLVQPIPFGVTFSKSFFKVRTSKFEQMSLFAETWQKRLSSFVLWVFKQHSKMSPQVGWTVHEIQKSILQIFTSQYKYLKSCSKNLILRTRLYCTGFYQLTQFARSAFSFPSGQNWKWSPGNFWYSQVPVFKRHLIRGGPVLEYFWIIQRVR